MPVEIWMGALGLIALICAVWVIYDILKNQKKMKDIHKLIWILCAVFFSILTAIVYFLVMKTE